MAPQIRVVDVREESGWHKMGAELMGFVDGR